MKTTIAILIVSFILSVTIAAQQTPDFSTVKSEKGMMVLNNNKVQPFSFLVSGKNPTGRQNDDGSLLVGTDSGVIVVYFVRSVDFLAKKKTDTAVETLIVHRDHDISTQEKAWKAKLNDLEKGESFVKMHDLSNKLFPTKLAPTLYWLYTAPKPDNTDRTLYQTVLLGDQVLMLGAVFEKITKADEVRSFLTQTLESITLLPIQKQTTPAGKKIVKPKALKR